jgi:uncharacterized membrane protein
MNELLLHTTEYATTLLDLSAVIIVVYGTLEALFHLIRFALAVEDDGDMRRSIWLRYARWLVAALTFQLAADILETSIAPDWDTVGQLAAIALIRTFLNYFLEQDLGEIRDRQREGRTIKRGRNAERA